MTQTCIGCTIAIISGSKGDGIVPFVALLRGKADNTVQNLALSGLLYSGLDKGGKRRQSGEDKLHIVSIRIRHCNGYIQDLTARNDNAVQIADLRGTIGVFHDDREFQSAAQGHTRAVTVVGGGNADVVDAGLCISGLP